MFKAAYDPEAAIGFAIASHSSYKDYVLIGFAHVRGKNNLVSAHMRYHIVNNAPSVERHTYTLRFPRIGLSATLICLK